MYIHIHIYIYIYIYIHNICIYIYIYIYIIVLWSLLVSFSRPGKRLGPSAGPWWCRTWASRWPPFSASRLVENWDWMVRTGELDGSSFVFYKCLSVSRNITQTWPKHVLGFTIFGELIDREVVLQEALHCNAPWLLTICSNIQSLPNSTLVQARC